MACDKKCYGTNIREYMHWTAQDKLLISFDF